MYMNNVLQLNYMHSPFCLKHSLYLFYTQVKAKGTGGKQLLSNISSITVNLVDENDNSPVFNVTEYSFTIKKNQTVGSIVGEVCLKNYQIVRKVEHVI